MHCWWVYKYSQTRRSVQKVWNESWSTQSRAAVDGIQPNMLPPLSTKALPSFFNASVSMGIVTSVSCWRLFVMQFQIQHDEPAPSVIPSQPLPLFLPSFLRTDGLVCLWNSHSVPSYHGWFSQLWPQLLPYTFASHINFSDFPTIIAFNCCLFPQRCFLIRLLIPTPRTNRGFTPAIWIIHTPKSGRVAGVPPQWGHFLS